MKLWVWAVALVLGGVILRALDAWRKRREYDDGPAHYVEQIQVLKADKPLDLPAIRPLKGVRERHAGWGKLMEFGRR